MMFLTFEFFPQDMGCFREKPTKETDVMTLLDYIVISEG